MCEDVGQYDEGPLWCLGWACRYQAKLQQNLMYLAAIADAQPQAVQSLPQVPLSVVYAHIPDDCLSF
jgi:hypothetical protein